MCVKCPQGKRIQASPAVAVPSQALHMGSGGWGGRRGCWGGRRVLWTGVFQEVQGLLDPRDVTDGAMKGVRGKGRGIFSTEAPA